MCVFSALVLMLVYNTAEVKMHVLMNFLSQVGNGCMDSHTIALLLEHNWKPINQQTATDFYNIDYLY